MRSFIAIDLPDAAKQAIAGLQADLRVGRVMSPDTFHLTLSFLGEQSAEALEDVHYALETIAEKPFELQLSGLGTFGGSEPRVLFAGVTPEPALDRLHSRVKRALRDAGVVPERRKFHPHVTLARFNRGVTPEEIESLRRYLEANAGFRIEAFDVTSFALFQSRLTPEGAIHTELARYRLA